VTNKIAADTSTWVAFANNQKGEDVVLLDDAIQSFNLVVPPLVITELLSNPKQNPIVDRLLQELKTLPITEEYWQRAGKNRRILLNLKHKAKIGDALIAQSCIDHDVPLLTRDVDFKHFQKYCGLKLVNTKVH